MSEEPTWDEVAQQQMAEGVQRWNPTLFDTHMMEVCDNGEYVLYSDHERLMRDMEAAMYVYAEQQVAAERERLGNAYEQQSKVDWEAGYGFGQADERAACIEAVEALPTQGIADGSGFVKRADVLAALRARGEQA